MVVLEVVQVHARKSGGEPVLIALPYARVVGGTVELRSPDELGAVFSPEAVEGNRGVETQKEGFLVAVEACRVVGQVLRVQVVKKPHPFQVAKDIAAGKSAIRHAGGLVIHRPADRHSFRRNAGGVGVDGLRLVGLVAVFDSFGVRYPVRAQGLDPRAARLVVRESHFQSSR